jgi:lactoylglutathione lyase
VDTVNTWPGPITAITLFADDLAAARSFYIDVLGLPVHYEDEDSCVFLFGATMINLLDTREAPDLIDPAPVGAADAGARFQLTLTVDDVDAVAARLQQRGAALLNGPLDRPWGVRTAAFADPTGTVWELAAPIRG